jgi:4-hydroxybenzoyl-CoA thioesterase
VTPGKHVHPLVVRFGDCDPAGIVYFPRFFDWFHQAMETWFSERLGVAYADVIRDQKIGFPAVRSEADFVAPCPLGDALHVVLSVQSLGKRSLALGYEVVGASDGKLRARGRTHVVVCDLSTPGALRSVPVPEALRAAIVRFGVLGEGERAG